MGKLLEDSELRFERYAALGKIVTGEIRPSFHFVDEKANPDDSLLLPACNFYFAFLRVTNLPSFRNEARINAVQMSTGSRNVENASCNSGQISPFPRIARLAFPKLFSE